ncbi:MAG: CoB--CoM heterodisulfide reductase iron-sulfur subunit A family protein [Candidatus Krumholzibacteriota bacterium]|nr:CoB--CoM heterodisulfide reductase iron-sulfur subunit A family protein [Candidatus Krumholzibacteriota bacterium]
MAVRIGVYICHCGTNIAGKVNIDEVVEFTRSLENVSLVRDYKFMCSDPGQALLQKDVEDGLIDRVVVASCSPLMHENTFRKATERGGLNPYLFTMANIREQCSWVHIDSDRTTDKAKDLISAAVRRAFLLEPLTKREVPINPRTVVIGGGIAGIQAALDLAEAGKEVVLVEREPSIGGHMAKFDKTFPTLDCSACILTPRMVSVGQHPKIELMTYSEVEDVSGYVGNFNIRVRKKARYVDPELCNGCGACWEKCPGTRVPRKGNVHEKLSLGPTTSIYMPFMQAVPAIPVIDTTTCLYFKDDKHACGLCAKECERGAIKYDMEDELVDFEVGNIILATGFQTFDPSVITRYGYGKLDNIMTAIEFEIMNCASGSTGGKIQMADGSEPKSIGIVHCVGSRDNHYHDYCSRVCCMYSLKYSHLIKEKTDAEVYEFYIDMRCFGKGYEEFYDRLLTEDVRFIRGKVAEITDVAVNDAEKGKLIVRVEDTLVGSVRRVPLDMVVLSTGLEGHDTLPAIAKKCSVSIGRDGFIIEKHPKLGPVSTATDGVFIAGACQSPKDIPDTVAQASAASSAVLSMITREKIEIEAATAEVDEEKCSGCKLCNTLCPYLAVKYDEEKGVSVVNQALCKGCGTCVAGCPSGAISAKHFEDRQIFAEIEGIFSGL